MAKVNTLTFLDAMIQCVIEVMGKEIKRKRGIMFMLVLTAELDRLTSMAQVYDDGAEPDLVTTSAYFRYMRYLY